MPIPSCFRRVAPLLAMIPLVGCAAGPGLEPGLAQAIQTYYAGHATEEGGDCRTPQIDTIQTFDVMSETTDGEKLMAVRYSYFDRHADMDADWSALFHSTQPCGGFAEREFTVARTDLGYRVVAMSGEQSEDADVR